MRNLLCLVVVLSGGASVHAQAQRPLNALTDKDIAQGKLLLFDGEKTSGWMIEGEVDVQDGALVLGGTHKTWVRIAPGFNSDFELHLEYRAENSRPIQFEWQTRQFLGGGVSISLHGPSKNPGEWIEAVFRGEKDPAKDGWLFNSEWRVLGQPEYAKQPLGRSATRPPGVSVGFEVPAGQRLFLRNVRVRTVPQASPPWLFIIMAGALTTLLLLAWGTRVMLKKRRAAKLAQTHAGG